jgi:hypothetical protein
MGTIDGLTATQARVECATATRELESWRKVAVARRSGGVTVRGLLEQMAVCAGISLDEMWAMPATEFAARTEATRAARLHGGA